MRVAVLLNRSAGAVVSGDLTPEGVAAAFARAGVDAAVELCAGGVMAGRARAACGEGFDAVVAAGGDGTVRCVAAALAGTEVPLGVLPLGTLNHFAKDLGIPADLEGAARVVGSGVPRALDLGSVNGERFVNNAVLGFYPVVVEERDRERRRTGRGKWLAAAWALARVLPRVPALRFQMEVDGERVQRKTRLVFVGNNEYEMNVFTAGARNRFDSGDLYLYVADCPGRRCLLGLALYALVRDARRSPRFESWKAPELTIESSRRRLTAVLDGEVVHLTPPLVFRNETRVLRVIAPG
ncbi:MAG TPA: diacylglycerol kinase family protein [Thermoanaerobaculia bacterium]|jgi:diacylglycerol kinase family enzyme